MQRIVTQNPLNQPDMPHVTYRFNYFVSRAFSPSMFRLNNLPRFMTHMMTYRLRKTCPSHTKIASVRKSRVFTSPHGDILDNESIYVDRMEHSKNDEVERQADEAFDPNEKTEPMGNSGGVSVFCGLL
jgi:hypothetical protein